MSIRKCAAFLISAATLISVAAMSGISASAAGYQTYTYSNTGDIVFSPDLYTAERVITGNEFGLGALVSPDDISVDENGNIYIADTGNNRVIIYYSDGGAAEIKSFIMPDGSASVLKEPEGICCADDGCLYICDTGNNRILKTDISGNVQSVIGKPDSQYYTEGIEFIPERAAIDSAGNIYVAATGAYQGLSLFSAAGSFIGFYGAEEVEATADVLKDYVWKRFMTEEQRSTMASYVPPEACNIYVTEQDFVLTIANSYYIPDTSEKSEADSIRLLNPKGVNTIAFDSSEYPEKAIDADAKYLNFTAGCIDKNGFITLLDNSKNKIFRFDSSMKLLGVFGGTGTFPGSFTAAADVDTWGGKLFVLDSGTGALTVFSLTEYGSLIHNALTVYNTEEQSKAIEPWRQVLEYNPNYDLAYVGIGRALLNGGDAKEAMHYFELGHDSRMYNDAFAVYRTEAVRAWGGWVLLAAAVLAAVIAAVRLRLRKNAVAGSAEDTPLSNFRTAVRHPFLGFERLRSRKTLSFPLSCVCLAFFIFLNLFRIQFTGEQFEMLNLNEVGLLGQMLGSVLVLLIWTVSNWCFSVLIEGKATFREIWITSVYCLIPYTAMSYIRVILSNFLVREEGFFSACLVLVGIIWSFIMLIAAMSYFHEFEGGQIIKALLLTLFGMAVIAVLIFVVYMLMQQLISTVLVVINEILFGIRTSWR